MAKIAKAARALSPGKAGMRQTPQGDAGYDNPRENVDPRIVTKTIWLKEGIYWSPYRYFIWDSTEQRLFMRAPELINFQISDVVVARVTYTSFDIQSRIPLKFYVSGKYCGFRPPAVPSDNVWDLPAADAAGYFKSDGSNIMSISNPLYSEVKRSDCVNYIIGPVGAEDVLTYRQWQDETVSTFVNQPDVPRNITVSTIPEFLATMTGTVTVNGIDADGAVIQEVFTINEAIVTKHTGNRAFALVTSIVADQTDATTLSQYAVGRGYKIGLPNYPFQATTDVFKVKKAHDDYGSANWTVNATYGTVEDSTPSVAEEVYHYWYRPFK